ncbi:ATP-binding protein [Novosphingobium sp. BL-8H]|uniref:chemotaxis protein CheA n=1 Tax=Novosphingobium sp. BL-8H TaxID=3127640 RepID=UPI00375660FC
MLEQFLLEGRDLVAQASSDFELLSQDPTDRAAIDSAFRAIHTLKGSVTVFALLPAERVLHAAEDILDRARRGGCVLDPQAIAGLIACIDQTDRWIDAMERDGFLPPDALEVGERTIATLPATVEVDTHAIVASAPAAPAEGWLEALRHREARAIARVGGILTAFRYLPDEDCFFRGEDPLAAMEGVPDLIALSMEPRDGRWPDAQSLEPFSCFSYFEGLSTASEAEVRAAFRLASGTLKVAVLAPNDDEDETGSARPAARMLRVPAERLDGLADGLGDLVVAINGLAPVIAEVAARDPALAARLRGAHGAIERAADRMHRDLAAVRRIPLESLLRRLPRLAREIADSLGKKVRLTVSGAALEVDKQIAEGLFEPLLHLLRNAIDHGIEAPDARRALAKDAEGRIDLYFQRQGGRIVATLRDDGAGMSAAQIRQAAMERGMLSAEAAQALDDDQALGLIFQPGFTTARAVSQVSGRGVGMDAVRTAVEAMRGTIAIQSAPGSGTSFRIDVPANALTTALLVVSVAEERYGISLDQVVETVRLKRSALLPLGSGVACVMRERTIPVLDLAALLAIEARQGPHARLVITSLQG